jgi:hypothetical protein
MLHGQIKREKSEIAVAGIDVADVFASAFTPEGAGS